MRKPTQLLPILAALLAAGCAATGELYADRGAVPAQSARITVFRTADHVQYSGRAASLLIDGQSAPSVRVGGFLMLDVAPGEHRLEVDLWDVPGRCVLSFTASAGATSYFEVTPRGASFAAGLPGSLLHTGTPAGLLGGLGLMLGGMAAESSGKGCGGAFAITAVEAAQAEPRLGALRALQ